MCDGVVTLEQQRLVTEERQEEHEALLTLLRKFAESTGIVEEYSKELAESAHLIHTLAAPEGALSLAWIDKEVEGTGKQLAASLNKQKQIQSELLLPYYQTIIDQFKGNCYGSCHHSNILARNFLWKVLRRLRPEKFGRTVLKDA